MKKILGKLNWTAIIVALIIVLPIVFYIYQNISYKNKTLAEQTEKKKRNQESYDNLIYRAQYEYLKENRDKCWVYNHDAIDCDLTYFESYKLEDTPQTKFKKAVSTALEKFPASERLYTLTNPDFKSLLEKPLGNLSEREAVRKILALKEFKDFIVSPEGTLRYDVPDRPTENTPYWLIHVYKDTSSGEEITLNYYKVDAFTGEISTNK